MMQKLLNYCSKNVMPFTGYTILAFINVKILAFFNLGYIVYDIVDNRFYWRK